MSSANKTRLDPTHDRDFDEQLWPINLGILLIAAAAAGFVGATSTFPDPNLLDFRDPAVIQTGWGRLAAVALAAVAAMLAVVCLQRWIARRVLFCLLLGLIIHLWLGVYLHEQYLEVIARRAEELRELLSEEDELTVVPDYHISQISPTDVPQSFEKPVEAVPPRESQPLEVEKKAKEHEVVAEQPAPVPQTLPDEPPSPLRMDRAESSVPLQADRAAGIRLSRQTTPDRPEPNEPIPQPATPRTAAEPKPTMAAQDARAQRRVEQAPAPDPARQMLDDRLAVTRAQLDRQSQQTTPALAYSQPRPTARQVRSLESEPAAMDLPNVPAAQAEASPNREAARSASSILRSDLRANVRPSAQAAVAAPPSSPDRLVPQSRRAAVSPQSTDPTGVASQAIARAARTGPAVDAPASRPTDVPTPTPSADPSRTVEASTASRAARRADSPAATGAGSAGPAGETSTLDAPQVAARLGRPRTHTGDRPALDSGGAGNPLSRSTRALPTTPTNLPAADQMAATGTGEGTRPDTDFDASVAGPTRRMTGTTTEMAVGRASTDPLAGTLWGEKAHPVPIRRAETVNPSMAPAGSSGGGLEQLSRTAFAPRTIGAGGLGPEIPETGPMPLDADPGAQAAGTSGSQNVSEAGPFAAGGLAAAEADPSTAAERMESLGADSGPGVLAQAAAGSGTQGTLAMGAGPAALTARRGGAGGPAENMLAAGSTSSLPRRLPGPLSGPSIEAPLSVDSPGTGASRDMVQRPSSGPASSQAERLQAGPSVPIRQAAGPGGLSEIPGPELGTPNPLARPESVVVHTSPGRFMLDRAAGRPPLDASLMKPPAAAFKQRFPGERNEAARKYGATDSSDRAVEQGLHFLARCQFPDGRWAIDRLPQGVVDSPADAALGEMNSDTAATGLALLAFLGKGYTHVDFKYRNQVGAGLRWLIANQQEDGSLFNDQSDQTLYAQFYAHGIATIALGEAYGMTWDEELRGPLQRAIAFTLAAQHPDRGGWRYRIRQESDTSVSGWHLMALKSAQMAGIEVPTENLARVSGWLDLAQGQDGSQYRYNPYALDTPAQRQGRVPSPAMTAEGLLMRFYLGRERAHPETIAGADYLRQHLPGAEDTPADVYYLYYATQVMFQMQGEYWPAWNNKLRPLLESTQVQKGQLIGSWSPVQPARDRWGHAGGRLYVTAMNLLMLEVYYRHMPLFREL
ncbi:MAG: hypothetical protein GXX96_32170 [Planctomycetaceae bacterium]|nr:hypothetical protein [Planctomycetaceae bacterium]